MHAIKSIAIQIMCWQLCRQQKRKTEATLEVRQPLAGRSLPASVVQPVHAAPLHMQREPTQSLCTPHVVSPGAGNPTVCLNLWYLYEHVLPALAALSRAQFVP